MKSLVLVILAVVALTQAKYLMSPNGLSAAMDRNEMNDEPLAQAAALTEMMFIPMARHVSCNGLACLAVCRALGWTHGRCVSDSTCQCYD